MMDASVLLPPTGTPLTGIDFVKRLPCGDVEKTRRVRARSPAQDTRAPPKAPIPGNSSGSDAFRGKTNFRVVILQDISWSDESHLTS